MLEMFTDGFGENYIAHQKQVQLENYSRNSFFRKNHPPR